MSQTSSNSSSEPCSSVSTPDLTDLILLFVREQFPNSTFTIGLRWGYEIHMDGMLIGAVFPTKGFLRWCWTKADVQIQNYVHGFTYYHEPNLLDVVREACESRYDYK